MTKVRCSECGSVGTLLSVSDNALPLIHDLGLHQHLLRCKICKDFFCLLCIQEANAVSTLGATKYIKLKCPACKRMGFPINASVNLGGNMFKTAGERKVRNYKGEYKSLSPPADSESHAMQLLERFAGRPKLEEICRRALLYANEAQGALGEGDWEGAIRWGERALDALESLPASRTVLGVVQADLAAAHCNQGNTTKAGQLALRSIKCVGNSPGLGFTLGSAYMILGICQYRAGDKLNGKKHFDHARQRYEKLPGHEPFLRVLEENERQLLAALDQMRR